MTNALGTVADVARNAAMDGSLNALAPNFSAGVQGAAQREVENASRRALDDLRRAQIEALQGPQTSGPAQTDLGKITADELAGRITPEEAEAKRTEILAKGPQQTFNNEKSLRDEFFKTTKGITDAQVAVSQGKRLLAISDNPVAELASFISLIKSIDNSTVREGELRNFGNVSGIIAELEGLFKRAKGEGAFSESVRNDIIQAFGALEENLAQMDSRYRQFYNDVSIRSKLNPQNVTGLAAARSIDVPLSQERDGDSDVSLPDQSDSQDLPEI